MSRIKKKHWYKCKWNYGGVWETTMSLCGKYNTNYANAKRKVTCKTCLRMLGNPLTLGEKK